MYNDKEQKLKRSTLRNNMPQPERILWYYLKGKNLKEYKFRRQYGIGNYILDFYCPELKLAIEIDGDSHFIDSMALMHDQRREQFLTKHKIHVIRFTNSDITRNIDVVMNNISEHLL